MNDRNEYRQTPSMSLFIEEKDIDEATKNHIINAIEGVRVLGNEDNAMRVLYDALPRVIAKRLQSIIPSEFSISQVELKLDLTGTLCGLKLGGQVTVKLSPRNVSL